MQQVLDGGTPLGHAPTREPVLRHAVEESCAVRIAVAADDDVNYAQGNSPEIIEVGVEEVHADVSLDAGRQDHRDVRGSSDRKSTRLNSSHRCISYAVFCLKKKTKNSR